MKDLQSIPKTLKEKTKGVNKKQLALKCAPYVIFGYVLNKVSWLYGQQAGDGRCVCKPVSQFYAKGFTGWRGMRDRISYGSIL